MAMRKKNNLQEIRKRIFDTIQIGSQEDVISRLFDYFIVIIIGINLFVTLFSTFAAYEDYKNLCDTLELITIIIFTVEYAFRIWTAKYLYPNETNPKAIIRFIFSFYGLVDLLTFLPYYLPIVFPSGAVAFRIFRVIRIFRLFRLNAQYDAFNVIIDVLAQKKNQLLSSMCMIIILMVSASLCMYSLEHDAQPNSFQNAFSGIWWSASTLLTVGYGDIYPVTIAGKIMGILISFLGVGMVAIPTGIISAGFVEQYSKVKKTIHGEDDLKQIILEKNHPWVGKKVGKVAYKNYDQVLLLRNGAVTWPDTEQILQSGDCVIFIKIN